MIAYVHNGYLGNMDLESKKAYITFFTIALWVRSFRVYDVLFIKPGSIQILIIEAVILAGCDRLTCQVGRITEARRVCRMIDFSSSMRQNTINPAAIDLHHCSIVKSVELNMDCMIGR